MNEYEKLTENGDAFWRHVSRSNFYLFSTSQGAKDIETFVKELEVTTILDYGCGNNNLSYILTNNIDNPNCVGYDPYIPYFSTRPTRKELTVCFSVLHMVGETDLDRVIRDIHSLTERYLLIHINKIRPNQRRYEDYVDMFSNRYRDLFLVLDQHRQHDQFHVSRKNLETGEVFLDRTLEIETMFFLLKIIP